MAGGCVWSARKRAEVWHRFNIASAVSMVSVLSAEKITGCVEALSQHSVLRTEKYSGKRISNVEINLKPGD